MKRKMTRIKLMEIILALEVRIMVGITDAGGGFHSNNGGLSGMTSWRFCFWVGECRYVAM